MSCHCRRDYSIRQFACIWDVIRYDVTTIRLHLYPIRRHEARAACQADGGELATLPISIRSDMEKNIINILRNIGGTEDYFFEYFLHGHYWYDDVVLCLTRQLWDFYYRPYCRIRAFTLCEYRISKSACESDDDCDSNATCGFDQFTNSSTLMPYNDTQKMCNCNLGFYGNGSSCFKTYPIPYRGPITAP